MKIKILFVASECAPFAKVGGLGDVLEGLPKALSASGLDVSIIIPKYEQIDVRRIKAKIIVRNFPVLVGKEHIERINVYQAKLPSCNVRVYFIENEEYLSVGEIYFERTAFAGTFKEIQRFLFFSNAVKALLAVKKLDADIVHCNDWHTGALVNIIRNNLTSKSSTISPQKTIFTIHNLANQGIWSSKNISAWFGPNNFTESAGQFNFMAEGIRNADMITTVSESYSKEILTKQFGEGLEQLIKKMAVRARLTGILNGVDYSMWPVPKRNRAAFQKMLCLAQDKQVPIFGLVARLTYQKGINLVEPLAREFAENGSAQFVFLGSGGAKHEKVLLKLARDYPKSIYARIGFDEKLARRIYAQSDFFLMPSIFEPSGLGQLISMHYGTIPIVRATGGLKDSVDNSETGFVFNKADKTSLRSAMKRAIACYKNKACFKKISECCRERDFSWKRASKKYIRVYSKLLKQSKGASI